MRRSRYSILMAGATILLCCSALFGQDNDVSDTGDDPMRGVARISMISGIVNVKRGDSGDFVAAALNAPLMREDHLQTMAGSKAEVQFDYANMIRLGENSDLGFADVQQSRYQLQLGAGTALYRVLRESIAQAEIDTPSVSVRPTRQGEYRITVLDSGETEVTVRSGQAEIYSSRGSQTLAAGRTMIVRGTAADPEFQVVGAVARDSFDDWNESRDRELARSRSYDYVSRDIYGAEDLDNYGTWVSSEYGPAWRPRVAVGWAPYRYGRWIWVDYYGWTWVSYDPWGWAPYHYGRWFYGRSGWCWYPGSIHRRHYWRPALVGFFGYGSGGWNVSAGLGFRNIGWVPLAPYDRWRPWYGRGYYGRSPRTFSNITIVNHTNITNIYRNARFHHGITGVNIHQFGRGHGHFIPGRSMDFSRAELLRGPVPIAPSRDSLHFSNRQTAIRFRPGIENRRFFTRSQPGQVTRIPFAQQQMQMQRIAGQAHFPRQGNAPAAHPVDGISSMPGVVVTNPPNHGGHQAGNQPMNGFRGNSNGSTSGGWRRFGQPMNQALSNDGAFSGPARRIIPNEGFGGFQRPQQRNNSATREGMRRFNPPSGINQADPSSRSNDWQRFAEAPRRQNPTPNFDRNQRLRGVDGSAAPPDWGRRFRDSSGDSWQNGASFNSSPQPYSANPPAMYRPSATHQPQNFGRPSGGSFRHSPRMNEFRMNGPSINGPRFSAPSGGSRVSGGGDNSGMRPAQSHPGYRGR